MNRFLRNSALVLSVALAAALGACSGESPETAQTTTTEATSVPAPETKPGLSLSEGRLILPAVSGNPAAAYFTLTNNSPKAVTVAAVDVTGSMMVMLHETKQSGGHSTMADLAPPVLKPGQTVAFAPGGKHVMIHDVPAEWKVGGSAELTLTFADGDKLSAPLAIKAVGSQ